MFLAIKELAHSKKKFALIISVVVLVSYLVYFLTSLAYGLASSYTNAVTNLDSDYIVMTVDANDNMMMSFMSPADFDNVEVNGNKARLGLFPAVIKNPNADQNLDTRLNIYLFGIENDAFIKPKDITVDLVDTKVVVSDELKKEGYALGDLIAISGSDLELEIVGFTKNATFQTAPVIYMNLTTWKNYRFASNAPLLFSGLVVRGEVESLPDTLALYTTDEYIFTLPGYTAQ